ncbi:hypothetical protein VW23_001890 [Devosia insulae DS-56]|uniref:D,D-heptose 1,7-bisphosphate phosphatase n=1 Tax=Devosia insulae DS-56 TaxID=1116389 RepID=A0A1E5XM95_9HYPH|nr:hypothetical protein VW23_001890 [Devosia insulae DS-56]
MSATDYAGGPALFLDRDGVVVEESHYLGRAEDVVMIPGVAEAIAEVNRLHIAVVLVTNQAGIARGYYDWSGFAAVQTEISRHLAASGARLDAVFACAYHGEGHEPYRISGHAWRKPGAGMLVAAADMLGIDLRASCLIGDTVTDLQAGRRAGLGRVTLVTTGHGALHLKEHGAALATWPEATVRADAAVAIGEWLAGR